MDRATFIFCVIRTCVYRGICKHYYLNMYLQLWFACFQWNFPSPDALGGVDEVDGGKHFLRLSISVSAWVQMSVEWWEECKGWRQETSHVSECSWPPDRRDKTELRNDCLLLTTGQLSILEGDERGASFRVFVCCLPRLLSGWIIHISLTFVVMGIGNSGFRVTLHSVILSPWNKRVTQWMYKMVTLSVVTKCCGYNCLW